MSPSAQHHGKRSVGTKFNDGEISTIAEVNIKKASESLSKSKINATSYRGMLLLTGQVHTSQDRELATKTASEIKNVRQVYNELEITDKISLIAKTSDGWLSKKVKTKATCKQRCLRPQLESQNRKRRSVFIRHND